MLKISYIRFFLLFILLVLAQVVILNRVSLLGYAVPIVYIYFILKLPIGINRNVTLLLGFILGFTIDIFCNTPGVNAAATTFAALLRRPIMSIFFMVDEYQGSEPAISTLGISAFMKYSILLLFIHIAALVSIESFSYLNIKLIILRIISSTLISAIIIFAFEGFSMTKHSTASSWRKV